MLSVLSKYAKNKDGQNDKYYNVIRNVDFRFKSYLFKGTFFLD